MERNDVERLMDIANALDEWKNAGGDSLTVAGAIQRFVYNVINRVDPLDEDQ